jgi:hypothetical protein
MQSATRTTPSVPLLIIFQTQTAQDCPRRIIPTNTTPQLSGLSTTRNRRTVCRVTQQHMTDDTIQHRFEQSIESRVGRQITWLRDTPIDTQRREVEGKFGSPLTITSRFPFIGRGNVLRDHIVSHAEVEKTLDAALR